MRTSHPVIVTALVANVIASCGTEPSCDAVRCENDPPGTQARIDSCESQLSHPACGALAKALLECIWRETSCDRNGKSDLSRIQIRPPSSQRLSQRQPVVSESRSMESRCLSTAMSLAAARRSMKNMGLISGVRSTCSTVARPRAGSASRLAEYLRIAMPCVVSRELLDGTSDSRQADRRRAPTSARHASRRS